MFSAGEVKVEHDMKKDENAALHNMFLLIEADAVEKETSAAYDGQRGDNGASKLREQVKFFKAGQIGNVPSVWQKYYVNAKHKLDPEWTEFQRLQKKFKGACDNQ